IKLSVEVKQKQTQPQPPEITDGQAAQNLKPAVKNQPRTTKVTQDQPKQPIHINKSVSTNLAHY
ncbi:hypothetical protein AB0323_05340, partial [Arthrobacter sp. NPDC080031]|uniref:hypothetical protein n=1 Tax=Arthrobacter sp. NPDC080031 TaxID=3155918 RepID=UPI00344FAD93